MRLIVKDNYAKGSKLYYVRYLQKNFYGQKGLPKPHRKSFNRVHAWQEFLFIGKFERYQDNINETTY